VIVVAGPSNEGWLSAHSIVPVKAVHLMADEVWLANCRFTSHRERNIVTRALQGLPLARRSFR
jgi:hypothetical protein